MKYKQSHCNKIGKTENGWKIEAKLINRTTNKQIWKTKTENQIIKIYFLSYL